MRTDPLTYREARALLRSSMFGVFNRLDESERALASGDVIAARLALQAVSTLARDALAQFSAMEAALARGSSYRQEPVVHGASRPVR